MIYTRRHMLMSSMAMALITPACAATEVQSPEHSFKTVGEQLARKASILVASGAVAGISVGISNGRDRKTANYGFANLKTKKAITEMTSFRIASVTKPITAVATLRLIEKSALSLDDTIDAYFPDFPRANEVTIYHLLTHTSGIPNWWGRMPAHAPADFMSGGKAHYWLSQMDQTFLFTPGTQRDYSNSGYVLLGEIIERVTKLSFQKALEVLVLRRFGALFTEMENSQLPKPSWAEGHTFTNGQLEPTGYEPMPFAAGGLRSCLNDLLSFSDALFSGILLTPKSLSNMITHAKLSDGRLVEEGLYLAPGVEPPAPISDTSEMGYGLGVNTWVQSGERFYSHAGLISGFGSYWIHSPRTNISAVILANTQNGTSSIHESVRQNLREL